MMMHSSTSTSSSDETPLMSNMSAASSSVIGAGGSVSDALSTSSSHHTTNTTTTSRTGGSMRRAAAMAAAKDALASSSNSSPHGIRSSSRPSSPFNNNDNNSINSNSTHNQPSLRSSSSTTVAEGNNSTTNTMMLGPQRRRHRATPADNFHPRLITAQILSLQCFHYTIQGFLFQINFLLYNTSISIDRIFTDVYVQLWHPAGWPDVAAIFISALFGAVLLAVIVEKSKKCLDFCVTYFLLHLILSSWYSGHFPRTSDWWIVHLAATLIMVLVGEYLCSRKELSDIPLLEI